MAEAVVDVATERDLRAARMRLGEALPEGGWLGEFVRACVPLTDAPVEFHLAAGMAALAAGVGNRRWRTAWGITVYPALWVVLVAPSSFWRKSTAITLAERLVRDADPALVMPSEWSPERFLDLLEARPDSLLTQREFGGFLGRLQKDYMTGSMEMLTDLYDGPDVYTRSLKKTTVTIKRPSLTMLAATTVDWLEKRITEDALAGGFLARFLFVTAATKASPKGLTDQMESVVRARLVTALHALTDRPAYVVELSAPAREAYETWMSGWEAEVTSGHHRSDLTGFAVRLQVYALKFAMLYQTSAVALADPDADRVIEELAMSQAIAYCRHLWANVTALIDEDIAISREAKDLRRILGIVGPGITRSDALKRSKMKARDFDQLLTTLVQSNQLAVTKKRAADIGLDRERNTVSEWLAVPHRNGSRASSSQQSVLGAVPENYMGTGEELQEGEPEGNHREPVATESFSSSLSTSLPYDVRDSQPARERTSGTGDVEPEDAGDDWSGL